MNPCLRTLLALVATLIFSSCATQRIYFPDSAPSFGFREKGHFKILASAKLQTSRASDTVERVYGYGSPAASAFDVGYAFASHWAVYGAYRGVNNVRFGNQLNEATTYNGRRGEAGIVYFTPIGRFSAVEAMAGAGLGSLERTGLITDRNYDLRYQRASLQTAVSFQSSDESIRGYTGLRVAAQNFYRFSSPNPDLRYTIGQSDGLLAPQPVRLDDITARPLGVIEPYLGFEAGYRWIRFVGQSGLTIRYFGPHIGGSSFYVTGGVGFQWPALPPRSKTSASE